MIDKIILIGMRGSGKSHFGTCLANELGWAKIDTDDEIERLSHKTVARLINDDGWENFREWEHSVSKKASQLKKVVISTGGGAITFERNKTLLVKNALVVFLFVSLNDLVKRLKKDTTRPALTQQKSLQDEMTEVWNDRHEIYFDAADIVFRAKNKLSRYNRENVELNARVLAKKIKQVMAEHNR